MGYDEVPEDEESDIARKSLLDISLVRNAVTRFRPLSLVEQEELVD